MINERVGATVVAWLLPALLSLSLSSPAVAEQARVRVVTSIPPLAMIVAELGGERVDVHSILPAGVDPHLFEPRPSDMRAVAEADLVVILGSSLDDWIEPALRSASVARVLALDPHDDHDHYDGHGHGHDHDPHVWLDPTWVRDRALRPLQRELVALDPAWASLHGAQARAMGERLTDLDDDVREMLADVSTRSFLALHPAWGHFARRFGLRPVGAVIEGHGREPSLHAMIEVVWAARAAGVRAVLVEPQVDARLAGVLAAEIGAGFEVVDPLGDRSLSDRSSYGALLRFNARAFARALGKRDDEESEEPKGDEAIEF